MLKVKDQKNIIVKYVASNFLITGTLNAILNKNIVPKNHGNVKNVVDNINDLTNFKAHTCDSAKPPHFKKNKQNKSLTITYEPSTNHMDQISSSAYCYHNNIDFLNIVDVLILIIIDTFHHASIMASILSERFYNKIGSKLIRITVFKLNKKKLIPS